MYLFKVIVKMFRSRDSTHSRKISRADTTQHLTCRSLRHTFGHDLLAASNDLQKVAMLIGHYKEDGTPNIEMTMIYTTPGAENLESISWTCLDERSETI
ncbi:tyrosine-type recombinase/integrase [Paenibacillus sp. 19GGS1-52]|nr:tyrosine-type recombinase/integrase [Paenibacillus sp. 19GGS1-52]